MTWASLIVQLVKNLPAMQETLVQILCWKDPLEKGKATHSCIIHGVTKSRTRLSDSHFTFTSVTLPNGTIIIINQFKYSFISPKEISLASDRCSWS